MRRTIPIFVVKVKVKINQESREAEMHKYIAKVIFDSDNQGTPRNKDIEEDVQHIKKMIESEFAREDDRPVYTPDMAKPGSSIFDSDEKSAKESLCIILYITEDFNKNYWAKFISDSAYLGEILSANPGRIIPIVKGTAKVPRQAHLQNRLGFTDCITDLKAKLCKAIRSIKKEVGEEKDEDDMLSFHPASLVSSLGDAYQLLQTKPKEAVYFGMQSNSIDKELHQRVLSKCVLIFMEKITDINLLLDQMMAEELILRFTWRDIREQTTTSDKIRLLLTVAIAMDKEWYMRFKFCLEMSSHQHILEDLNAQEEQLKSDIASAPTVTRVGNSNLNSSRGSSLPDNSQQYIMNALEELKRNEALSIQQGKRLEKEMVGVLLVTALNIVVCLLTRR